MGNPDDAPTQNCLPQDCLLVCNSEVGNYWYHLIIRWPLPSSPRSPQHSPFSPSLWPSPSTPASLARWWCWYCWGCWWRWRWWLCFLPIVVDFSINNIFCSIDLHMKNKIVLNIIFWRNYQSRWFFIFICSYSGGTLRVLAALAVVFRGELVLPT